MPSDDKIRLNKILAEAGAASRRHADGLIADGRVRVNGNLVTQPGAKADPRRDHITLDGKPLGSPQQKIYILMHKPEGVVTTARDPEGRKTVLDLLPDLGARVYPVGRLDYDSSGLLLLTNDGALAQRLTHPASQIKKTYHVKVSGTPSPQALKAFAAGLVIEGKKTAPCQIKVIKRLENEALLQIILREGRNRQIRKMCEAVGHPVLSLKRVAMGPLRLGDLPRGGWRYLTRREVEGV
jgi:pseudouridine synthase